MGRRLRVLCCASGGEASVPPGRGQARDLRGVLAAASAGLPLAAGSRVDTGGDCLATGGDCLATSVATLGPVVAWRGAFSGPCQWPTSLPYQPASGESSPSPPAKLLSGLHFFRVYHFTATKPWTASKCKNVSHQNKWLVEFSLQCLFMATAGCFSCNYLNCSLENYWKQITSHFTFTLKAKNRHSHMPSVIFLYTEDLELNERLVYLQCLPPV